MVPGPAIARRPRRLRTSVPGLEPELLRLLLDVVVVQGRALLRRRDAGPDLDQDLLQVRSLDRREELERDARLLLVDVLLRVGDQRGRAARDGTLVDRVRTGREARLVLDRAAGGRVEPGQEL